MIVGKQVLVTALCLVVWITVSGGKYMLKFFIICHRLSGNTRRWDTPEPYLLPKPTYQPPQRLTGAFIHKVHGI